MRKIEILKKIDHYVGLPLCVGLGVINKIFSLFRKGKVNPEEAGKILILKWFGLGSIIIFSPFLKKIKEKYKKSKIIFLTFPSRKGIVELFGICDEIRTISTRNIFVFVKDTFRELLRLSMEKIDVCIDLEFFSKFSTLIAFLSGAKARIGLYLPFFWRNSLINFPVYFNPSKHIKRTYKMVCGVLGINVKSEEMEYEKIKIPQGEKDKFKKKYLKEFLPSHKLVVINPNAGELAECRRWPKEYFVEVVEWLCKKEEVRVIFIGTKEESSYVKEIIDLLSESTRRKVLDVSGKLNIKELIALIDLSFLVITNDSGPFHLACLENTASVSIWGPGDPQLFGVDSSLHKILYLNYDCSPCIYLYQTKPALFCKGEIPCLREIKPSWVIEAVEELWNEKKN